jgi:hypothetical protein
MTRRRTPWTAEDAVEALQAAGIDPADHTFTECRQAIWRLVPRRPELFEAANELYKGAKPPNETTPEEG